MGTDQQWEARQGKVAWGRKGLITNIINWTHIPSSTPPTPKKVKTQSKINHLSMSPPPIDFQQFIRMADHSFFLLTFFLTKYLIFTTSIKKSQNRTIPMQVECYYH